MIRSSAARAALALAAMLALPALPIAAQNAPAPAATTTSEAGYRTAADSAVLPVPITGTEMEGRLTFRREVFTYASGGRRDPFASLMSTGEIRPLVSDLRLVAIAFDSEGRTSVAILRDLETNEQYRVRVGQLLGRLRVARISRRDVTFTIEEFGFSRQETLTVGDSPTQRTQQ